MLSIVAGEAEADEPEVVKQDEGYSEAEHIPPEFSDLCRNPLCVDEVCDLDTEVNEVYECTDET